MNALVTHVYLKVKAIIKSDIGDFLYGDVTGDGLVNVVDVQCTILVALWELGGKQGPVPPCVANNTLPQSYLKADHNCDGSVNVVDSQIVIKIGLGDPLDPALDGNQDRKVDACEL